MAATRTGKALSVHSHGCHIHWQGYKRSQPWLPHAAMLERISIRIHWFIVGRNHGGTILVQPFQKLLNHVWVLSRHIVKLTGVGRDVKQAWRLLGHAVEGRIQGLLPAFYNNRRAVTVPIFLSFTPAGSRRNIPVVVSLQLRAKFQLGVTFASVFGNFWRGVPAIVVMGDAPHHQLEVPNANGSKFIHRVDVVQHFLSDGRAVLHQHVEHVEAVLILQRRRVATGCAEQGRKPVGDVEEVLGDIAVVA